MKKITHLDPFTPTHDTLIKKDNNSSPLRGVIIIYNNSAPSSSSPSSPQEVMERSVFWSRPFKIRLNSSSVTAAKAQNRTDTNYSPYFIKTNNTNLNLCYCVFIFFSLSGLKTSNSTKQKKDIKDHKCGASL